MKKENDKLVVWLAIRYFIILIIALLYSLFDFFYNFLLKATIYPTNFLLNLIYPSILYGSSILIEGIRIDIIPACVAVSAYLLLLILNLTTPMSRKQRTYSIIFSIFSLLVVNILRIFIFSILLIEDFSYFKELHMFTWYFLSLVFIVGLWFLSAYIFKIKNIPVYSDLKSIIKYKTKERR